MGTYELKVPVTRETLTLYYISVVYKIDFQSLSFLYEKFGPDVFFFFYLLSGRKFSFPSNEKFIKIVERSEKMMKILKGGPQELETHQDTVVYAQVQSVYAVESNTINLRVRANGRELFGQDSSA